MVSKTISFDTLFFVINFNAYKGIKSGFHKLYGKKSNDLFKSLLFLLEFSFIFNYFFKINL